MKWKGTWLAGCFVNRGQSEAPREAPDHEAVRADDLNKAVTALWAVQGTHTQPAFEQEILPMYRILLAEFKQILAPAEAEQKVIDLLEQTTKACRRRWHTRLPQQRPGTDYRKYEITYTDALVTAMAVDSLLNVKTGDDESPDQVAERIIPRALLQRLRGDPVVWADWLGYFDQSSLGGLYSVSCEAMCTVETPRAGGGRNGRSERPEMPQGAREGVVRSKAAGWSVVDAIKACIADGTLSVNQPGDLVQVDRDGRTFLQSPAVFEEVKTLQGLEEGARNLENRFARLKINKETSEGWKLFNGKSLRSEPMVKGYVVEDDNIFWDDEVPQGRFVVQGLTTLN